MDPDLIHGNCFRDPRGYLYYNNDFDFAKIKRIYFIENSNLDEKRGWQGHRIEQRWYSAVQGSFKIQLILVDKWDKPILNLPILEYIIESQTLDILHIPRGYISSIQSLEQKSKLIVLADYYFGEINDEFRYPMDYFQK
jgi:dTDP-4-dehydrorhamnose 3,5-epimerase-like enzyme